MALPGSRSVVEKLVEEHFQPLFRYAYRLTGSSADAEDLTQETFCKAQLRLAQLRDLQRARAWLFSILRNAYLQRKRLERVGPTVGLSELAELPALPPGPLPDVEPQQLQAALGELDDDFRAPVILYYFEDFTYRDIAEHLELPIGTVMSRLSRAKAFLRMKLLPVSALAEGERASQKREASKRLTKIGP